MTTFLVQPNSGATVYMYLKMYSIKCIYVPLVYPAGQSLEQVLDLTPGPDEENTGLIKK